MVDLTGTANVALISAVSATCVALISVGLPLLSKSRGQARKRSIEDNRAEHDRVESSYQRLERENIRLAESLERERRTIADLRTALAVEQDLHAQTRGRCERNEAYLRRLGYEPPTADEDDENGRAR